MSSSRYSRITVPEALRQDLTRQYAAKYQSKPSQLETDWSLQDLQPNAPSRRTLIAFFGAQTAQSNYWLVDGLCQLLLGCSFSQWQQTHNSGTYLPMGALYNVPALPPCYIERSHDLQAVQSLLAETMGGSGSNPIVAILGTGGIGKTSLAIATARSTKIQEAFPKGIFWLTLGSQPKLILRQLDLLTLVTGETFLFQDIEQGKIRLEQQMAGRKILLILDDVWSLEQLRAFKIPSSQLRILVTTRDRSISRACQANTHRLQSFSNDEAVKLLEHYYPDEQIPAEISQKLLRYTENHPLTLAILGTRLMEEPRQRWETVANGLQTRGLMRMIRYSLLDYQHDDLLESIEASIRQLSPEIQNLYRSLAIFPKFAVIPEPTLVQYWQVQGLNEWDAEEAIYQLLDRSLLKRSEDDRLSLYSFHYDYLQSLNEDPQYYQTLHSKLIQSYRAAYPDGLHTVESDGYFYRYITYHLQKAQLQDDLYIFLSDLVIPLSQNLIPALAASSEQIGQSPLEGLVAQGVAIDLSSDTATLKPENISILRNCFEVYMSFEEIPQLSGFKTKEHNFKEIFGVFIRFLEVVSESDTKWRSQALEILKPFLDALKVRAQGQTGIQSPTQPQLLMLLERLLTELKHKSQTSPSDSSSQSNKKMD